MLANCRGIRERVYAHPSLAQEDEVYSLAGNFLIWQASTPCWSPTGHVQAGLLGALDGYSLETF
jgi:hypothetical protein